MTYQTAGQKPNARTASCGNSGQIKTVTFILNDAWFPGQGRKGSDLQIHATKGDAVIRLERVIKLQ